MTFPLDNINRKRPWLKTFVIHDATGRIVMQVCRVTLQQIPGETVTQWTNREIAATAERTSAVVRLLNSASRMARTVETVHEQMWLPGIDTAEETP